MSASEIAVESVRKFERTDRHWNQHSRLLMIFTSDMATYLMSMDALFPPEPRVPPAVMKAVRANESWLRGGHNGGTHGRKIYMKTDGKV